MLELEVNQNSYVDMQEADAFVETYFMSTSEEYKNWFDPDLSENDKKVALIASARALNNLRYKGRKAVSGQRLAFPRRYGGFPGVMQIPFVSQFVDSSLIEGVGGDDGLESAKEAQVVNALDGLTLDPSIQKEVTDRSIRGIKAMKSGTVSETYDDHNSRSEYVMRGIYNKDKITYILNAWITDSVFSL